MRTFVKKISIPIFLLFLIGLIIVAFFAFFLRTDIVDYEDFFQIFFNYHTFNALFSSADHGCFISWMFMKIIGSFVPLSFGVHPSNNMFGNIFIGLDFAVFVYLISSFASISSKKKFLSPIWYILAFALLYPLFWGGLFGSIITYCRHFRYVFTAIFYLLFWRYYIKAFIQQENPSQNLLFINTVAFVVGLSVETVNLSTLFSIIFLSFFQAIILLIDAKFNFSNFLNKIKKTDIKIYSPILLCLAGMCVFYLNPSFWRLANDRNAVLNMHEINALTSVLPDFIKAWFNNLFVFDYHNLLMISLIALSLILMFIKKDSIKNRRLLISAWILVLGVSAFYFTLIVPGKTYFDRVNFWVVSVELKAFVFCIFLAANFLLLGPVVDFVMSISKKERLVTFLLLTVTLAMLLLNVVCSRQNYFAMQENQLAIRKLMYRTEKIYVFYADRNETAILPESLTNDPVIGYIILAIRDFSGSPSWFLTPYYKCIYNKDKYVPIKLLPDDQAMKEFYSRGGVFEPNEIKKANFTKLLDSDFVLNKKSK